MGLHVWNRRMKPPHPGNPSVPQGAPLSWRRFALNIVSPAVLTFALFLGLIFGFIIPTMRANILERKRELLREVTQAVWSEFQYLHEQEQLGAMSRAEAQGAAVRHVRKMRYGLDGKDYFWISDFEPRMVVHPYRPDLDGQGLADYADPAGKRLFVDSARIVAEKGSGYLNYLWQWKDDESHVVPKLSYVKGFAPWGWIVGTGIYIEDVREEIRQVTRQVLWVSVGISAVIAVLLGQLARQGLKLERSRGRAEAALRESEEKYRTLVEGSSEGVVMVLQEQPVFANRTLLNLLGYSAAEFLKLPLDRIVEPLGGAAASHGPERPARLFRKDGQALDVLLAAAPVAIGERTGQILSVKDVNARRKTEETLARLVAELQSMLPLATRPVKASQLLNVSCGLDTPIHKAAALMAGARSSAILVKPPGGEPVGIVTDSDLRTRLLAARRDVNRPVSSIMSAPLECISDQALLFEAAVVMQERDIRHLVVTDERGEALGILNGTEILHAQRHALALLLSEIHAAQSPEEIRDSRAKLSVFVRALLESGVRVENITRILTSVADAITCRLIALAEAELGPPPSAYAFVALGSEARGEQTLATDQDNAIVFEDVEPARAEAVQAYFLRLGAQVCGWLDLAGYRSCKGGTMASNPKWCQPLSRWRDYFTDCLTAANPQDLLDVNIFFDFRCVHGESTHVLRLREHLHDLLAGEGRHAFFFHLAQSTLQFRPPRGFFGNIQLEASGEGPGAFNIKAAIIPLVNFARIYALRNRIAETNTLERLARLREQGQLLPSSHDELAQGFTFLMQARLTHQAAQAGAGAPPDNLIDLDGLTQLERSMLKKVFADITVFQARLETDFARTPWTGT
jgi:PAS domain S-box-containing protein